MRPMAMAFGTTLNIQSPSGLGIGRPLSADTRASAGLSAQTCVTNSVTRRLGEERIPSLTGMPRRNAEATPCLRLIPSC